MIRTIFYCVWFANIASFYCRKDSKIITSITFIFTILLFGGNFDTADYVSYKYAYETGNFYDFEIGYVLYNKIIKMFGFDYVGVTITTEIILLTIMMYMLIRLKCSRAGFFSMLFFLEQIMGIAQVRMFIASVLLAMSIVLMINKRKLLSIFVMLIGVTFQKTICIYLPFFIVYDNMPFIRRNLRKILIISAMALIFATWLNFVDGVGLLRRLAYYAVKMIANQEKANAYTMVGTRLGGLFFSGLYFVNIAVIIYIQKKLKCVDGYRYSRIDQIIWHINLYAALILPFLIMGTTFYRVFRLLNIINYVYFAFVAKNMSSNKRVYRRICFAALACCAVWKAYHLYLHPSIYDEFYLNNYFFGGPSI